MYDTRTPIESTVVKFGVASYAIVLIERVGLAPRVRSNWLDGELG
jgi:hypothetical protein